MKAIKFFLMATLTLFIVLPNSVDGQTFDSTDTRRVNFQFYKEQTGLIIVKLLGPRSLSIGGVDETPITDTANYIYLSVEDEEICKIINSYGDSISVVAFRVIDENPTFILPAKFSDNKLRLLKEDFATIKKFGTTHVGPLLIVPNFLKTPEKINALRSFSRTE